MTKPGAIGSGYDWLSDPRSAPYRQDLAIGAQNSAIAAEKSGHPENALSIQELANQIGGESSFDPNAVNPKAVNGEHAAGIAGILPSTAKQPGYGLAAVDLTDPHAAIQFAGAYDGAVGIDGYSGGGYKKSDLASSNGSTVPYEQLTDDQKKAYNAYTTDPNSVIGGLLKSGDQTVTKDTIPANGPVGIVAVLGEYFTRSVVAVLGLLLIGGGLLMFRPVQNAVQNGASIARKAIK